MSSERSPEDVLADPSHPIWKLCFALLALLGALWGVQNGAITPP
jgi:hypothetical protein